MGQAVQAVGPRVEEESVLPTAPPRIGGGTKPPHGTTPRPIHVLFFTPHTLSPSMTPNTNPSPRTPSSLAASTASLTYRQTTR